MRPGRSGAISRSERIAARLLGIARGLERAVAAVGRAAGWLLPLLAMLIVTDVVLRRWFVIGSVKLQELEWHLHGTVFLFALGYAYLKGAHVRIELLHERLSPKAKAWIELAGLLLALLPFCAAVLWFGFDYAERAFLVGESSPSPTGLPHRWIVKSILVAGVALLALAGIGRVIRVAVYLFGPASLHEASGFARGEAAASHLEEERV